jgi:glycosyltransferase involved in cell wall biosynthesis
MRDEAENVSRALLSVPCESGILAIDAQSQDRSVEIAREFGARIVVRPWEGFVATRRFAIGNVTTPWTFMLDADEALDAELGNALERLVPQDDVDGYTVKRATYFCGRAMLHGTWGADMPLRFFRTSRAALVANPVGGGVADVHERWTVPGRTETVPGTLLHYSYPTLAAYGAKLQRYTTLEAHGLRGSPFSLVRESLLALLRVPNALFVRSGWLDGWRGAYVAAGSAAYPVIVAWKALRS